MRVGSSCYFSPTSPTLTNPDHSWDVCIGVPYGTSLWQVADSKEQNGSFKIAQSKIQKKELLSKRLNMMMD